MPHKYPSQKDAYDAWNAAESHLTRLLHTDADRHAMTTAQREAADAYADYMKWIDEDYERYKGETE